MRLFSSEILLGASRWRGFGTGRDGDVVYPSSCTFAGGIVNARNFTLKSNAVLTTERLVPIFIKATHSITIEDGAVIDADGKGYTCVEENNKFGLKGSVSSGVCGSKGIGGGGANAGGGGFQYSSGGTSVSVNTFLSYIALHYEELLVKNDQQIIPLFGGGGGWGNGSADNLSYSVGGGAVILSAPVINLGRATLRARGLPGAGASWVGGGGGAGGWIGLFGNRLNDAGASFLACGGGGGGGAWGGVGSAGVWQDGGASWGRGYTAGGAGGGSTALNEDGGTAGKGGYGTQYSGQAGTTTGNGGYGGNATGSDRGGRGGAGGGAGKISWLQINR